MSSTLSFGRFEVNPEARRLAVDGTPAPIGARAFDVLMALLERRERVVSKAELLDLAWPGVVVEENNLSVQISTLRKVIGADSIATVTGRGYRFVCPQAASNGATHGATIGGTQGANYGARHAGAAGPDSHIVRRLSAIVSADLVDWAGELAAHTGAALAAWKSARSTLIEAGVPAFGGRVIELSAQGVLLEFASAVDAARWAVDLQQRLADRRVQASGAALHMRVGIAVEDVVVDDGKLVGDGGQAATRLLQAGLSDQIVVDDRVRAMAEGKLPVRFRALEGGTGPPGDVNGRRVYVVEPTLVREATPTSPLALNWETRPGVAVLPFSTDADDPYFGDGMTEEIITSLSANRGLLVIARNSTLRYRGSARAPAEIAAELGVRYLLVGSLRRLQHKLRIGAELVDASANRIIWAERYEGADEDLFSFQARIASSIAAAIDPRVQEAEIARVSAQPTDSLSAYDCVLRGLSVLYTFRAEDFEAAGALFARAIEIDPRYAQAHAHLAWWHNLKLGEGRSMEFNDDARQAERLSQRAVELDPRDAWALSVAGHIQSFVRKRFSVAMEMFDEALAINPSCASAWARSATTLAYLGRGEEAQERVRNAMRLSPYDQQMFAFCTTNGTAAIVTGRHDEAVGWLSKARRLNPGYRAAWRNLISALALAGERSEAREQAQEFLKIEPTFRVSDFGARYPLREPHLGTLLQGMRDAGLPD